MNFRILNLSVQQRYIKKTYACKRRTLFNFFHLSETDIPYLSQIRFEQFATITLS